MECVMQSVESIRIGIPITERQFGNRLIDAAFIADAKNFCLMLKLGDIFHLQRSMLLHTVF
jgi:hypothetical protein